MINIVNINGPICTHYSGILSKRILADLGVFKVTELRMWFKHALKGQKLLAQGNALGINDIQLTP